MRRLLLAAVAALALAAPGAVAAPAPQLRDPTGDWVLEGQDIVWGRLSGVLVKGVPHLRAELRLAAPPLSDAQTHYMFEFVHRCRRLQFHGYVGHLDPEPIAGELRRTTYCFSNADDPEAEARYPMTVTLRGATVTWVAPYVDGIRRGSVLSRFTASAFTVTNGLSYDPITGLNPAPQSVEVQEGDDAAAPKAVYVAGSDLPRR